LVLLLAQESRSCEQVFLQSAFSFWHSLSAIKEPGAWQEVYLAMQLMLVAACSASALAPRQFS